MVAVYYGKRRSDVDLTRIRLNQDGIKTRNLEGKLRTFVDNLTPGSLCLVEEKHVIAHTQSTKINLFRIGKRGLVRHGKDSLGIEVMAEEHPLLKTKEKTVLSAGFGGGFKYNVEFVNLTLGGVSTFTSWNEGTFSPSGGWEVHTRVGEYVRAIFLGDKSIAKAYPIQTEELNLRLGSVPFILPSQYLHIPDGPFGDITRSTTDAMIGLFTREKYLDTPMTREERDKLREDAEDYCSKRGNNYKSRKRWQETIDQIEKQNQLRAALDKMAKEGTEVVRKEIIQTNTLNAVGTALSQNLNVTRGHYDRSTGHYLLWEVNESYIPDGQGHKKMPRRGFELIPSKFMTGTIYAVPKNDFSAEHLSLCLGDFNSKYPDTSHVDGAKQNYPSGK